MDDFFFAFQFNYERWAWIIWQNGFKKAFAGVCRHIFYKGHAFKFVQIVILYILRLFEIGISSIVLSRLEDMNRMNACINSQKISYFYLEHNNYVDSSFYNSHSNLKKSAIEAMVWMQFLHFCRTMNKCYAIVCKCNYLWFAWGSNAVQMEQERRHKEKPKKKKYRKERMKKRTADEKKSFYFQKIQFSLILRNDQNYCQHELCVTGDMCLVSKNIKLQNSCNTITYTSRHWWN